MRAAVVTSFDHPPQIGDFDAPEPEAGEVIIHVRAAALSNLVKAQASGKHYSSGKSFPFVPGSDGVGTTQEGQRVYFFSPRAPFGAMAEQSVVSRSRTIPLPGGIDDVTAAALGNPGLASWGSLIGRARFQPGESVLIHGATGAAGQQAVQVAKYLGAKRILATGRDESTLEKLKQLGADEVISLSQPEEAQLAAFRHALRETGVDVVLDFLWGRSAELLLQSAGGHGGPEGEPRVRYVQIGSISGATVPLSAEWLRSSGVELLGSGIGSLSSAAIVEALTTMYRAYSQGKFVIDAEPVPLSEVQTAWTRKDNGRIVFLTSGRSSLDGVRNLLP